MKKLRLNQKSQRLKSLKPVKLKQRNGSSVLQLVQKPVYKVLKLKYADAILSVAGIKQKRNSPRGDCRKSL